MDGSKTGLEGFLMLEKYHRLRGFERLECVRECDLLHEWFHSISCSGHDSTFAESTR